jgi:hypothetical protein
VAREYDACRHRLRLRSERETFFFLSFFLSFFLFLFTGGAPEDMGLPDLRSAPEKAGGLQVFFFFFFFLGKITLRPGNGSE